VQPQADGTPPTVSLPLDHVGVIATDFAPFITLAAALRARVSGPTAVPEHGAEILFVDLPGGPRLEVIRPLDGEGGASPAGVHHVALRVNDVEASWRALLDAGCTPQAEPRPAVHGSRHAFADLAGTAIEVIAWPDGTAP
jgi:hypothetical protein